MAEKCAVYRCQVCDHVIEVLHDGEGELVCCQVPMTLLVERNDDTGQEKHVPVLEKTDSGFLVKVGEVAHPMEDEHCIDWIEVQADGRIYRQPLEAGDQPQAHFDLDLDQVEQITLRSFCNIHGLWRA
ncbi:MAG: desulfoferrodoxin [Euryarchaeota archaeon]|nr:desulfoferrodoxin [Euryarchaeota archaeon]